MPLVVPAFLVVETLQALMGPANDRPTRTTGWMKPLMTAALRAGPKSEAFQTLIPCMQRLRTQGSQSTAKRSVTRVNDQAVGKLERSLTQMPDREADIRDV